VLDERFYLAMGQVLMLIGDINPLTSGGGGLAPDNNRSKERIITQKRRVADRLITKRGAASFELFKRVRSSRCVPLALDAQITKMASAPLTR